MPIPSEISNLVEQLQGELTQIDQETTAALEITRSLLDHYPNNSYFISIFATLSNYLVFVEISRRRIDYTTVIIASETVTDIAIREAGETLSELLGRVLEAKIVVNTIKSRLENW